VGAGAQGGAVSEAAADIRVAAGVETAAGEGVGAEVGAGVVGITEGGAVAVSFCADGWVEGGVASDVVTAVDSLLLVCGSDTALGCEGSLGETIFASFFSSTVVLTSFCSCFVVSAFLSVLITDSVAAVL